MRVRSISLALVSSLMALFAGSTTEARKSTAASIPAFSPSLTVSRLPLHYSTQDLVASAPNLPRGGETSELLLSNLLHRLKIASYFALWYALNVVYNSKCNKDRKDHLNNNILTHSSST
jgi:hypothetical protein